MQSVVESDIFPVSVAVTVPTIIKKTCLIRVFHKPSKTTKKSQCRKYQPSKNFAIITHLILSTVLVALLPTAVQKQVTWDQRHRLNME